MLISDFLLRVKNQEFKIQDISDPLLDGKRESRNEIQDFKRRNIKNQERIMTIHT